MAWYALFVETSREDLVQQALHSMFDPATLRCIVPRRRVPERREGRIEQAERILFPGYVLISGRMDMAVYRKVTMIHRVYKVLRYGGEGVPWSEVPEREMAPLLALLGSGEVIGCSQVLLAGSRAVVVSGPLCGLDGLIRKIDRRKHRAKIALTFLGVRRTFDVGIEVLAPMVPAVEPV